MSDLDSSAAPMPTRWPARFAEMQAEWALASAVVLPEHWVSAFLDATEAQADLVDAGMWVGGPRSLLGVLGERHREVRHSRILGWLVDPTGRHGLGVTLLQSILSRLGLDDLSCRSAAVALELECFDRDSNAIGYVDVVVTAPGWRLVIENKVWSGQSGAQLDHYYKVLRAEATYFVYLTPNGVKPYSQDREVAAAWKPLSWRKHIVPDLEAALGAARARSPQPDAIAAVEDYLVALKEELR